MAKSDDRDARRRKLQNAVRPADGRATADGWTKTVVPLPATHNWKCSPGHLLLVADRGEVAFEYPDGWHVSPGKDSVLEVRDRPFPKDECRIQLSIIRTPGASAAAFGGLPLDELLRHGIDDEGKEKDSTWQRLTEPAIVQRPGLHYAWAESRWLDREHGDRPVLSRQLIARAPQTHPFITFDYYEDRAETFRPVWLHMVQTLRVASPRTLFGDVLN